MQSIAMSNIEMGDEIRASVQRILEWMRQRIWTEASVPEEWGGTIIEHKNIRIKFPNRQPSHLDTVFPNDNRNTF